MARMLITTITGGGGSFVILQDVMGWATGFFIPCLREGQQKTVSTETDFAGPPPLYFMTSPLGSLNSSHSIFLQLLSETWLLVTRPLALLAFADTSGIHTGNTNSSISNGINQRNRGALHGYQVELGGSQLQARQVVLQAKVRTGQLYRRSQNPVGLGGVDQASSNLATPPQPGEHNQPSSTGPPQLSMEYQSRQKRRLGRDKMSHCTCFYLDLLTRILQLPWCPSSKRIAPLSLLLKNLKRKRVYPVGSFPYRIY